MTKPTLISLRECAKQLTTAGDPIKNPALGRYVRKYQLKRGTGSRRSVLVDFAEVKKHRKDNFTREWMRGGADAQKSTPKKPAPKINPKSDAPARTADSIRESADTSENIVPIDRARNAKTLREESLAQQELLNLEERRKNLIHLDQAEAGIALAADAMRDVTQGSPASDFADALITKLKLPSKMKREVLAEVKAYGVTIQTALYESALSMVSSLSGDDPSDVRDRHDALAELAFKTRNTKKTRTPKKAKPA